VFIFNKTPETPGFADQIIEHSYSSSSISGKQAT